MTRQPLAIHFSMCHLTDAIGRVASRVDLEAVVPVTAAEALPEVEDRESRGGPKLGHVPPLVQEQSFVERDPLTQPDRPPERDRRHGPLPEAPAGHARRKSASPKRHLAKLGIPPRESRRQDLR